MTIRSKKPAVPAVTPEPRSGPADESWIAEHLDVLEVDGVDLLSDRGEMSPTVRAHFESFVKNRPERAVDLLWRRTRESARFEFELHKLQGCAAKEWYELQGAETKARVDARLGVKADLAPGFHIYRAVTLVKEELKAEQGLRVLPGGSSMKIR